MMSHMYMQMSNSQLSADSQLTNQQPPRPPLPNFTVKVVMLIYSFIYLMFRNCTQCCTGYHYYWTTGPEYCQMFNIKNTQTQGNWRQS